MLQLTAIFFSQKDMRLTLLILLLGCPHRSPLFAHSRDEDAVVLSVGCDSSAISGGADEPQSFSGPSVLDLV